MARCVGGVAVVVAVVLVVSVCGALAADPVAGEPSISDVTLLLPYSTD
jgi:hypothetical protein